MQRHFAICSISALVAAAAPAPAAADEVWVTMDYVLPVKLERAATKIIVGNPGIADVTVEDSTNLLLFGKAPGATNLYIFDEDGQKVDNMIVRVRALGDNMLTYQRGLQRTTYNCTSQCEATVTVGDGDTFGQVIQQTTSKYQQAAGAAGG